MGRLFLINLEGKFYCCKHCQTHFALDDDIISKMILLKNIKVMIFFTLGIGFLYLVFCILLWESFHCRHGKAYLFDKVVNVTIGEKEERMMITGLHTVVDLFCVVCGSIVGWKYEAAYEKSQKYKEGKFILERYKVLGPDGSLYMAAQEAHAALSDADDI
ncbi:protein yippee-like isoform X1 [Vigna angularis]|nr:protein yippee-like isoform X1 [Vigna angularis]